MPPIDLDEERQRIEYSRPREWIGGNKENPLRMIRDDKVGSNSDKNMGSRAGFQRNIVKESNGFDDSVGRYWRIYIHKYVHSHI